jgi:hypothetical protein
LPAELVTPQLRCYQARPGARTTASPPALRAA